MANLKDINYGIGKYLEASDATSLPDIGTNRTNIDLLNFKVATNNAYTLYNFKDGMIDAYQTQEGVDATTSTNEVYDSSGDYYSGAIAGDVVTAFTSTGASTYSVPAATTQVSVLVVGGGGQGGGNHQGGGGGAGGLVYVSNYAVTGGASISLSVGVGGSGSATGDPGDNSTFGTLTANGGGGGGNSTNTSGDAGGSGGGGGTASNGAPGKVAGASNQPASFSPYSNVGFGNAGGTGSNGSAGANTLQAGGGGGAGGVGEAAIEGTRAGNGGEGKDYSSIWGTSYGASGWFAGGGGGGSYAPYPADTGSRGGGTGATACGGGAGQANTGSGGGGVGDCGGNPPGQGGAGGSGIVLVKTVAIYNNMTLVSNAQTAQAAPTEGRLMIYEEASTGTITLDTDLKGYVSRDGGTTYTQTPLTEDVVYEAFNQGGIDSNTKIMLHCDGSDSGTTFTDSSLTPHTVTANGNAHTDTTVKKFGTASAQFDGTGDYLTAPDSSAWDVFGSSSENWTIDFWVKHTDHVGGETYISQSEDSSNYWQFAHYHSGGLWFGVKSGGSWIIDSTAGGYGPEITDTNWHHVALCKVGQEYGIYLDGTQGEYISDSSTDTFGAPLAIGTSTWDGTNRDFDGYMDEIRIQKSNIFSATPVSGKTDTITVPTNPYTEGPAATGPKRFVSGSVDISGQPSGTNMKYKIETLNQSASKVCRLHGASLLWA